MARKFDKTFAEPVQFNPDGLHISRRAYDRQQAADAFQQCMREEIFACYDEDVTVDPDELRKSWVRWGFQHWTDQLPTACWLTCNKNDHGAQPTWELI